MISMAGCMLWTIRRDQRGVSNIIVVVLGLVIVVIIMSNVILWSYEMNQLDWEKMKENIAIVGVTRIGDVWSYNASGYTLGGSTSWVSGSVSDLTSDDGVYMTFRSYYSGTDTSDFVDNSTSDVDSSAGKGTHSNFPAQQAGPDGVMDTLLEGNTAVEQWVSPTGYEDLGNEWSDETKAYDDDTGTGAVDDVPGGYAWSQYLVLTHSVITCGKIQYYVGREFTDVNQVETDIYNGTWTNVYSGAGTWNSWTNVTFTETSVTKMRFRFFNNHPVQSRMVYVYEADFLQSAASANYELGLEVQWTSVDYDETNEELCIYAGAMGTEDLRVDYWTGSTWSNLLTDLTANNWNTINVNPAHFRNATGYWKMKVKGVKTTDTQFDSKVDWIEFKVVKPTSTIFTFENGGSLTCHLVSLWVINSTVHEHYDMSVFVNSGDTLSYSRMDIILPSGQYTVKVVTERGNVAVYSGS